MKSMKKNALRTSRCVWVALLPVYFMLFMVKNGEMSP